MPTFDLPSLDTSFGAHVSRHLREDSIVWLTTISLDGMPQPNPVWFYWDGATFLIYTTAGAARLRNLAHNQRVSLNFDSDADGNDIVIFTGAACVASDEQPADQHQAYLAKYRAAIDADFGGPAAFAAQYAVPLRVTPSKVRGF